MNIREAGARSARTLTTWLGVGAATLASIIGVSVWAGSTVNASNTSNGFSNVRGDDGGDRGGDDGFGASNGFGTGSVGPGQGGSHVNSSGS